MFPALKNNAAAGYHGPMKIELLEGSGLLFQHILLPQVQRKSGKEITTGVIRNTCCRKCFHTTKTKSMPNEGPEPLNKYMF